MSTIVSGNFTFTTTSIEGVVVVDAKTYGDRRGYFMETYKRPDFVAGGIDCDFVQDNQSSARVACYGACTTKSSTHRRSSCA